VGSFVILVPLHCKCSKSYFAYFGKKVECCTQEKIFKHTGKLLIWYWYNIQDAEWNLRFWERGPRQIIICQFITDIWSHR